MEGRIKEFDINKVIRWSLDEVKKYRIFINQNTRIENKMVMLNLMVLDKQIQDLQDNHVQIKDIRER